MTTENTSRKGYLDGLRGLAALGVVAYHANIFFSAFTWSHAFGDLPNLILARFTNGNFMVCIFFILSGYVLSIPRVVNPNVAPGHWGELVLRRYFRLTPVVLASVLITYFLWTTLGIPNQSLTDYGPGFAYMTTEYQFTPSLFGALYHGLIGLHVSPKIVYNPVLWTISIELLGSILLFCMFALYPKLKNFISMSIVFSILAIVFTSKLGKPDYGMYISLFFVGAIIHLINCNLKSRTAKYIFLLVALWLGSISIYTPEGQYLASTFSLNSFQLDATVHSIAAIMLLLVVLSSQTLKKVLCARPILWLGKQSFSLYAIHSIVIFSIGLNVFTKLAPLYPFKLASFITYTVIFIVSLALASILTKYIDCPSQRFSKWFARFLLGNKQEIAKKTINT